MSTEARRAMQTASDDVSSGLVTIRNFGNMSEALLAHGCLESAGIENFLTDLNITRLEWPITRGIRLQVAPDDVESADSVLKESALPDED